MCLLKQECWVQSVEKSSVSDYVPHWLGIEETLDI